MSTVINLYGGPDAGKSLTMARLFVLMKERGLSVEMAHEWVKHPVWAGEKRVLDDQLYILSKQNRMLRRLNGNVDYIVTDAPLLMSLVYNPDPVLHETARHARAGYHNVDVFLVRVKGYDPRGRVQTETEAKALDDRVWMMLQNEVGRFWVHDGNEKAGHEILGRLGL